MEKGFTNMTNLDILNRCLGVKFIIKGLIRVRIYAFWQGLGLILPKTITEILFYLDSGRRRTTFSMFEFFPKSATF